jgi:hypothetical protein
LLTVASNVADAPWGAERKPTDVAAEKMHTLGSWGEAVSPA